MYVCVKLAYDRSHLKDSFYHWSVRKMIIRPLYLFSCLKFYNEINFHAPLLKSSLNGISRPPLVGDCLRRHLQVCRERLCSESVVASLQECIKNKFSSWRKFLSSLTMLNKYIVGQIFHLFSFYPLCKFLMEHSLSYMCLTWLISMIINAIRSPHPDIIHLGSADLSNSSVAVVGGINKNCAWMKFCKLTDCETSPSQFIRLLVLFWLGDDDWCDGWFVSLPLEVMLASYLNSKGGENILMITYAP